MDPKTERNHPGIRTTAGSSADGLLAALGLTIIAVIVFAASLMYGFGVAAR